MPEPVLTVDRQADWRETIPAIPKGFVAIGVVRSGKEPPGVLAMNEASGEYVRLDVGRVTTLDQQKVRAALGLPKLR